MIARVTALVRDLVPRMYGDPGETRSERILRRVRVGIVIAACLVTLQSLLLVLGAWRNDRQIERNMGVAAAEVLDAGPRRSTIEFVTPDRVTYRPELGVLYPSELDTGMRIYVEYDKNNPDLVRVQDRNAALAIIPGRLDRGGGLAGRRGGTGRLGLRRAPEGAVTPRSERRRQARSGGRHQLGQPVVVVDIHDLVGRRVVNRWCTRIYRIQFDTDARSCCRPSRPTSSAGFPLAIRSTTAAGIPESRAMSAISLSLGPSASGRCCA